MTNIRTEIKTLVFFVAYFATVFICTKLDPGGPCTPGMGGALLFLSIPISLIYLIILFYKLYKSEDRQYLNSIYILTGIWILFFFLLKLNV
ncbi:hypothetical protein [Flavobacterium hibernum]|uniref:hypothetical protein n=1 Tax=Flavobacterium hibernum TaxID=37752 RepID=UPI000A732359|nr:hypothetical protein [Flavobacterium hibernum]STO14097.1 Uncharacterised protein [Flavobacterium hibernum]